MNATRTIAPELLAECRQFGMYYNVSGEIHPDDFIFWFAHDHSSFPNKTEAVAYYFATGRESAGKIKSLVDEHGAPASPTVLEFASGYGCVTRHLKNEFPDARLLACDIHQAALDFAISTLEVPAIGSSHQPENFRPGQTFDVVFAISFFSHMPKTTWQRWLQILANSVSPGGLLIFTTHGHSSLHMANNPQLDEDGFWFRPSSEQGDLEGAEYGSTMTSLDYVFRQIQKTNGVRLLRFQEAFWYGHQDVFVLRRL